jgi:hypothetical protein
VVQNTGVMRRFFWAKAQHFDANGGYAYDVVTFLGALLWVCSSL